MERLDDQGIYFQRLKRYSHDLPKAWSAFKEHFPDTPLAQFDGLIDALHAFESLRYPRESKMKLGAQLSVKWYPTSYVTGNTAPNAPPLYEITVTEIDDLVAKLFEVSSRNPKAFFGGPNEYARDAIRFNNPACDRLL